MLKIMSDRKRYGCKLKTDRNIITITKGKATIVLKVEDNTSILATPTGFTKSERKKLMEVKQQLNKFGAPPQSIWLAFHEILLHMEDKLENLDSISKTAVKNFVF